MHRGASDFYRSASQSDWYFILATGLKLRSIYRTVYTLTCAIKNILWTTVFYSIVEIWLEVWQIIITAFTCFSFWLTVLIYVCIHSYNLYGFKSKYNNISKGRGGGKYKKSQVCKSSIVKVDRNKYLIWNSCPLGNCE